MARRKAESVEMQLLTARLDVSNARLEVQGLHNKVEELQAVISQYQEELKEARRLLLKQRLPRRPFTSSTERQLIAAGQDWQCAGYADCPLKRLNNGRFDKSLYVIEHLSPWSASGQHAGNRAAWCCWCASVKTRRELVERRHRPPSHESEDDGESEGGAEDD